MATKCKGINSQRIEPSDNQMNPGLADPNDFEILENGGQDETRVVPFHGQCGDSEAEYNRLTKPTRDHGKYSRSTPRDRWGRQLAG
jgi:hypothetical protein